MTRHATLALAAAAVLLALPFAAAQGESVAVAALSGQNSVPPINTTANGSFSIEKGTAGGLTFSLALSDVSNLTMVHIHAGGAGESGPVVVPLVPLPSDDSQRVGGLTQLAVPMSSTAGRPIRIMGAISPTNFSDSLEGDTVDEFVTAMATGDFYVNVHTTEQPGGFIRGQITANMANGTMPGGGTNGTMPGGGTNGTSSPAMTASPKPSPAPAVPGGGFGTPLSSAAALQLGLNVAIAAAAAGTAWL